VTAINHAVHGIKSQCLDISLKIQEIQERLGSSSDLSIKKQSKSSSYCYDSSAEFKTLDPLVGKRHRKCAEMIGDSENCDLLLSDGEEEEMLSELSENVNGSPRSKSSGSCKCASPLEDYDLSDVDTEGSILVRKS